MPAVAQIRTELEQAQALKIITEAFSESSAMYIKMLRESFGHNSSYYDEISQVYQTVKRSAKLNKLLTDKKKHPFNQPATVHVAITSNRRFFGSLNIDALEAMLEQSGQAVQDRIVIGKTGISLVKERGITIPIKSVIFAKDTPTSEEMRAFLDTVSSYERVFVYYPKFLNMFTQKIDQVDVTYSPASEITPKREIRYIFEPELPKVLEFFETQIRYVLFSRVVLETELSRTATRLVSMYSADQRTGKLIKKHKLSLMRARRAEINAQLVEMFSSIKKWKTK